MEGKAMMVALVTGAPAFEGTRGVLNKLVEELEEFAACANGEEAVSELFDIMQVCFTYMVRMYGEEAIAKGQLAHLEKMRDRGYVKEVSLGA